MFVKVYGKLLLKVSIVFFFQARFDIVVLWFTRSPLEQQSPEILELQDKPTTKQQQIWTGRLQWLSGLDTCLSAFCRHHGFTEQSNTKLT